MKLIVKIWKRNGKKENFLYEFLKMEKFMIINRRRGKNDNLRRREEKIIWWKR